MATTFGVHGSYAVVDGSAPSSALPTTKRARTTLPPPRARGAPPPIVCLDAPSPYGVKPEGCALVDGVPSCRGGLGPLSALPDELVLHVLGFLSERALCAASAASRALYVFAHHGDLWRVHALARAHAAGVGWAFSRDWKTSVMCAAAAPSAPPRVHVPLHVAGVYSDLLFKHHSCAAAAIPPEWWSAPPSPSSALPAILSSSLSPSAFVAQYEQPSRPVILVGAAAHWPALTRWTPAALASQSDVASAILHCGGVPMRLDHWLSYAAAVSGTDDRPLYLFEKDMGDRLPSLGGDFDTPPHFGEDLTSLLPPPLRPDCEWLIGGPRKSGSTWHKDPNATSAYNALVWGLKAWILYPPSHAPPGVIVGDGDRAEGGDGSEVATPVSVMEWYCDHWPAHVARCAAGGPSTPLCGIQRPGDVVFIPAGWWHSVLNLEDSLAISHNFISPTNVSGVLELWRDDPAAIAGVPEALQEGMHAALRAALLEHRPHVLAAADAEERARVAAEKAKGDAAAAAKGGRWAALVGGGGGGAFSLAASWGDATGTGSG